MGSRKLKAPKGWMVFFDKVNQRSSQRYSTKLSLRPVHASTYGSRAAITFSQLRAGSFVGELVCTFHTGSPLIHSEAVPPPPKTETPFFTTRASLPVPEK